MNRNSSALWRQVWYGLFAAGVVAIGLLWWQATGHRTSPTAYSLELAAGNLTGLVGTYCILWQLVLLSRLTILEDIFGMEKLTWLHKWNGYAGLILILLHAVFLTLGYAAINHSGLIAQFLDFQLNWQDLLKATIGTVLLIAIVLISIGIVRRHMKYETWYYVHLFTYLAILLAFSHQLSVGSDLATHPAFQAFWYACYAWAVGLTIVYRVGRPVYLIARYRFRVEKLVEEAPGTLSVYITGRHIQNLRYHPGQFMIWRFLTKEHWWQAHPFSLSIAPGSDHLRLTAKQVGDFTRTLGRLTPGTWVLVDGPHGNFTPDRLTRDKLLLIAGGSGITPIRSMLERLPAGIQSVELVYAARTQADLALRSELEALMAARGGVVKYVLSEETVPGMVHGILDDARLRTLVPDATERDVLLCGPPPMMDAVTAVLERQGLSRKFIHTERFAY